MKTGGLQGKSSGDFPAPGLPDKGKREDNMRTHSYCLLEKGDLRFNFLARGSEK